MDGRMDGYFFTHLQHASVLTVARKKYVNYLIYYGFLLSCCFIQAYFLSLFLFLFPKSIPFPFSFYASLSFSKRAINHACMPLFVTLAA